jgi:hypothetical protein
MFVSQWKTRTIQNPNPNVAAATDFIPKKDEARVGGDQLARERGAPTIRASCPT